MTEPAGWILLAAVLGVFSIIAAANGDWGVFSLAYLDAVGVTALAAHERTETEGL